MIPRVSWERPQTTQASLESSQICQMHPKATESDPHNALGRQVTHGVPASLKSSARHTRQTISELGQLVMHMESCPKKPAQNQAWHYESVLEEGVVFCCGMHGDHDMDAW